MARSASRAHRVAKVVAPPAPASPRTAPADIPRSAPIQPASPAEVTPPVTSEGLQPEGKLATVEVLKPFHEPRLGRVVHPGETVDVDVDRHRALARNGLVPHRKGEGPAPDSAPREPGSILTGERPARRTPITGTAAETTET